MRRFFFPDLPDPWGGSHFTIPSLDGIRAISILFVLIAHCGLGNVVPGGMGVTIFFFLSGYLITTLMRREVEKTGTLSLSKFYVRRTLRILPPAYLVILVVLVVTLALGGHVSGGGLLASLFYYSNYYPYTFEDPPLPGLGILWSLAVEEHFYLAFPLVYLALRNRARSVQGAVLVTMCLLVMVWRCVLVFVFHAPTHRTYYATDARLDSILWGCLLALIANPMYPRDPGRWLAKPVSALVALGVMCFTVAFRPEWFRETFRYTIQALALAPLFAFAIVQRTTWVVRLLNAYPMRLIGIYTYSMYLTHFAVADAVTHWTRNPLVVVPIVFTASFALAAVLYNLLERPLAEIRKRFSI